MKKSPHRISVIALAVVIASVATSDFAQAESDTTHVVIRVSGARAPASAPAPALPIERIKKQFPASVLVAKGLVVESTEGRYWQAFLAVPRSESDSFEHALSSYVPVNFDSIVPLRINFVVAGLTFDTQVNVPLTNFHLNRDFAPKTALIAEAVVERYGTEEAKQMLRTSSASPELHFISSEIAPQPILVSVL